MFQAPASIRHSLRLSLVAAATLVALWSSIGIASAEGALPVGTNVPAFMLPVINDFQIGEKKQNRFGPAKWVGDKPQKKLVIMSFFATWCEPCKKEMPELARLYSTYKDDGLGVMLISIDKGKEKRAEVMSLVEEKNVTFPVLHDRFQVVARRYYTSKNITLPYMLIVGEDGKVQEVHAGFTEEVKNSLDTMIPQKLGLPGPKEAPQSAETDVASKSKEKETKSSKKPSKKSRSKKGKGKAKGKKNAKSVKKAKD